MSVNAEYRKRVIDLLVLYKRLNCDTKTDLHMSMEMLPTEWMSVTASTTTNCYRHAFATNESSHDSDKSMDRVGMPDDNPASNSCSVMQATLRHSCRLWKHSLLQLCRRGFWRCGNRGASGKQV